VPDSTLLFAVLGGWLGLVLVVAVLMNLLCRPPAHHPTLSEPIAALRAPRQVVVQHGQPRLRRARGNPRRRHRRHTPRSFAPTTPRS
jgi:hypothetical protein